MRTLVLVLAVFAAIPIFAQQPRTQLPGSDHSVASNDRSNLVHRLDALARAALERDGIPGLSVVVVQGSDTLLSAGLLVSLWGALMKKSTPHSEIPGRLVRLTQPWLSRRVDDQGSHEWHRQFRDGAFPMRSDPYRRNVPPRSGCRA